MRSLPIARGILILAALAADSLHAEDKGPWPASVPGWQAPAAGEHPRLFFRRSDLPEIRKRAATPEGQAIVQRLRFVLNGGDGLSLPPKVNPSRASVEGSGKFHAETKVGEAFTLWHAAGYGMLHLLTGEKVYAGLSRECVEMMLGGTRDRDNRYAFRAAYGALRAGPSLGAMAMAYDLGYEGWDEDFRRKVALAIQNYREKSANVTATLEFLVKGLRHGPHSNHWGCQIGGGALALLAIRGDPGTDSGMLDPLMEASRQAILRQLTEGFGDGGMFHEGKGPGGIASDTAFIPALHAWRVAGGQDFVSPRPHVAAITLIKVHQLLPIKGEPWYPLAHPSGYGSGFFGIGKGSDRDGLSRGGQFAQGLGAIPEKVKPAALWIYNHLVEPDAPKRTFDTVSPYPHRAVLALINWPIGIQEVNPAELLPRVHWDERLGLYSFRNQWTGTDADLVVDVTCRARDVHPLMVWGQGQKRNFGKCPKGATTHFQPAEDGSGTLTVGTMALGVDFSQTSGAAGLIVAVGLAIDGARTVQAGGQTFNILQVGGKPAEPKAVGATVTVGGQEISYDGKKIVFSKMAGPPKLPRMGCW